MRSFYRAVIACTLCAAPVAAVELDLASVDRGILKEPPYKSEPSYCLLVFGAEAKTKVWLVLDGETVYLDCNANGDLNEEGEQFEPSKVHEFDSPRNTTRRYCEYELDDIMPADGTRHTEFEVSPVYPSEDFPARSTAFISVKSRGKCRQYASPVFGDSPARAPVAHFDGPFTLGLYHQEALCRGKDAELYVSLVTPGLGELTSVYSDYDEVPATAHPVAEFEFPPAAAPSEARKLKFTLDKRC